MKKKGMQEISCVWAGWIPKSEPNGSLANCILAA